VYPRVDIGPAVAYVLSHPEARRTLAGVSPRVQRGDGRCQVLGQLPGSKEPIGSIHGSIVRIDPVVGVFLSVSHPAGELTYSYDDRGLLRSASDHAGTVTFQYDDSGRMVERSDPAGVHTFSWTERNELDTYTDPLTGQEIDWDWTSDSQPDLVSYGATGLQRDYDYDPAGSLQSDTLTKGVTPVSAFGYLYDDDGNLRTKSVDLAGNPMSGDHVYDYDEAGRLLSWDAPGQAAVSYQWDDSGNRVEAGTDSYSFDERNRLVAGPDGTYLYDPRGTLNQAGTSTYGFDGLGRLVDYNNEAGFGYDGLDRIASRTVASTVDTYRSTVAADAPVHWWHLDEPTGSSVATDSGSSPTNGSYVNSPTLGVTSPVEGTAMQISDWGNRAMTAPPLNDSSFTIEFLARPDDVSRSPQVAVTNTRDDFNYNRGWTVSNAAGKFKLSFGNQFSLTSDVELTEGEWVHVVATFDDASNQAKVWVDGESVTATYTGTISYELGGFKLGGQYKSYNQAARWFDGVIDEVAYWDEALDDSAVLEHYAAATGNEVTWFGYAGMGLDPVSDGSFTYSRSPAGRVVAQSDGDNVWLAGLDRHGDLTALLDPVAGVLTDTVVYDPFGEAVASTGTTNQTLGFQGDYTDPASGEVWMGARWYSGADAAFRSRDTVLGELSTPISLNRYTYAFANPMSYWDPDGRWAALLDGAGAAVTGFESDGTPIRAAVAVDRIERHNKVISAMETRAKIRELTGEANFENQSVMVKPASEIVATNPAQVVITLDDSQREFITNFLDGRGALPTNWGTGTDLQQYRYFAWATLANGGGTSLSYDEFKALETQDWMRRFDDYGAVALDRIMKGDCGNALWPWACEHNDAFTQGLLLVAGGALTVASMGGGAALMGTSGLQLAGGSTAVGALGAGGYNFISQGINGGGTVDVGSFRTATLQGGAVGLAAGGAAAVTQAVTRATAATRVATSAGPNAQAEAEAFAASVRAAAEGRPAAASAAAVDRTTGSVYYGTSGQFTVRPAALEGLLPKPSLEPWPAANCAEVAACASALGNGADLANLDVFTVRTLTGKMFPACDNCASWLPGILK